jgi:hypothetical protein
MESTICFALAIGLLVALAVTAFVVWRIAPMVICNRCAAKVPLKESMLVGVVNHDCEIIWDARLCHPCSFSLAKELVDRAEDVTRREETR